MPECWHFQPLPVNSVVGRSNAPAGGIVDDGGMSVANVIRTLRKERGLSQYALAAAVGWERGTIAAIESGHSQPGSALVQALATFFGVSTDLILNRSGQAEPAKAMTEAEAELLRLFRDATDRGREAVLATARAVAPPAN